MNPAVEGPHGYERLDGLLGRLAAAGPDLDNQFTNHAPMVVEALCALGRGDAAAAWLERYTHHLLPLAPAHAPVDPDAFGEALGRHARFPDWLALFADALAREPWRDVLARWTPRLLPGLSGAATHGVIRAGHAARALADADTRLRRGELAAALAYWAATYRALPSPRSQGGTRDAERALASVPLLPVALRRHAGSIDAALAPLGTWAPFASVAGAFDPGDDAARALPALSHLFSRVFLANAVDWLTTIVFVHALTSIKAVERLLPHLDEESAARAVGYVWQAAAALYSVYGTRAPVAPLTGTTATPADLVAAAVATGDEHAIKVTEACLDSHRFEPRPEFLEVARRAIARLG